MPAIKDLSQLFKDIDDFAEEHFSEEKIQQWCNWGGMPPEVIRAFYQSNLGSYISAENLNKKDSFIYCAALIAHLTRKAGTTLPLLSEVLSFVLLSSLQQYTSPKVFNELVCKDKRIDFCEAFSEPGAGTSAFAIRTEVSSENGQIYLDGEKSFVTSGEFMSRALVLAHDTIYGQYDGGISLWLVDLNQAGVTKCSINTIGQEMTNPSAIIFNHVLLDPDYRIKTQGDLDSVLKRQFNLGRLLVCASSLGLALAAMDDAVHYASKKQSSGKYLYALPQIQEKFADMLSKIKAMQALILNAANLAHKNDSEFVLATSLMKYYVPRAASDVASQALQIFGGVGYTNQIRVSRIWKDCRGNQIAQGTDEVMVHSISKQLIRSYDSVLQTL